MPDPDRTWVESYLDLCKTMSVTPPPESLINPTTTELSQAMDRASELLKLAQGLRYGPSEFLPSDRAAALTHPAEPIIRRMQETYHERRASYGPSEQRFADIALAMFPDGLTLRTRPDWVRYGLFHMILSKLARYTKDFATPHVDSIHDVGPYAAMLEAEDRRELNLEPFRT